MRTSADIRPSASVGEVGSVTPPNHTEYYFPQSLLELPADNEGMDEFTRALSVNPEKVLEYLKNPDLYSAFDVCATVAAAAQRCLWSGDLSRKEYMPYRRPIYNALTESGYWEDVLGIVKDGNPAGYEIQLVLQTAQQGDKDTQIRPVGVLRDIVDKGGWGSEARSALQGLARGRYGEHYNTDAPQLLAIAQAEVMRTAVFPYMDVTRPDPLADAMLGRLESYLKLSSQSYGTGASKLGGKAFVPSGILEVAKAMEQYKEDRRAYSEGHTEIENALGRKWRRLTPGGETAYRARMAERQDFKEAADARFLQIYSYSPEALANLLRTSFKSLKQEGSNYVALTETIGAAWAAIALRRGDPQIDRIVDDCYLLVQKQLEPYVLDGLDFIANGTAPFWQRLLTLESWYDNDEKISTFTPAYGPESNDYMESGEAMSDNIRSIYNQAATNPDGTKSNGYAPRVPQVGITAAFHLLIDMAKYGRAPLGMIDNMLGIFESTVRGISKRQRDIVLQSLPRGVHWAATNPSRFRHELIKQLY